MKSEQEENPFNFIGAVIIAMIFIYVICQCCGC